MTPGRWDQIKELAADALALPASERAPFLAAACSGDATLHAEVESLLAAEDPSGVFLEIDRPPDRIGAYRIVREIARGGMGTVYLGERADGEFEQRAAIKVVSRGVDSTAVVRRFMAERRILARLQHPHIARLFDGGVTADGRPYFVMEFLDAVPITEYCRAHALALDARLDLVAAVSDAVEHAHQHLVLHRDLKPANILVDASGEPKLVDFGIAKVIAPDGEPGTATEIGSRAMTPQYSSPEQVRGEPLTTASDIYALGLILYELVTERAPYEVPAGAPAEQARVVSETRPRRPSDAAPPAGARKVRGDLDTIVLKALEKEPERRYQRAADLSADLRRYRQGLPIMARPTSAGYRMRKYAGRHWRAMAAAAAAAIVLTWAIGDAIVQGRRAERHFQDLRALANSFVFEFHDAIAKLPGSTPARELVVSRALQYLDGLSREAVRDVELTREVAEAYLRIGEVQGLYYESNLGKTADARASFTKAAALFADAARARPAEPRSTTDLARAELRLASTFQATDPAGARTRLQQVVGRLATAQPPDTSADAAMALGMAKVGLAENQLSARAEAADARGEAIAIFTKLSTANPKPRDADRFLSMCLKRRAAQRLGPGGSIPDAIKDLSDAAAIDEARVAADPASGVAKLDLALGEGYLAMAERRAGNLPAAEAAIGRAMYAREAILAGDPRNARVRMLLVGDCAKLAAILREEKRLPDALAAIRKGDGLVADVSDEVAHSPDWLAAVGELRNQARLTAQAR